MASASDPALPPTERYAPDAPLKPYIPAGEPVDPAQVSTLSLNALLVYADRHSPRIESARARAATVDAERQRARIFFPDNPELSLGLGPQRSAEGGGTELEIALEQRFEIAGEPGLRRRAAADRQRLAEAGVDDVRWEVHVETHRLFVDVLLAEERTQQAEQFVAFARTLRDIASRQVEAGELSPLNLLVAEADLAQTGEVLIEARQGAEALRTQLAAEIGWPTLKLPPIHGELPPIVAAPELDTLLASMAHHHPSVRMRELAVSAGHSQLRLQEREAWPEPTLGLVFGQESGPGADATARTLMVQLSVGLPLWHRNQEGRARARAELELADRQRDATIIALRQRLTDATHALNAAVERVGLYESEVVPQLEQNLSLLQRAYELGEVDIHQVSQTRERLLQVTRQHLDARQTYYESAALLEGLVGTNIWPLHEETP
ncbi:TolC family protein [Lujinxingia litoralis]|uniref:TolC family protein n=1 Tax=Lujinxingia litoralis TaxID=2211119 RepID=UPI001314FEFD|nr:TolC family protein [Lujinxingia litoralis]